MLVQVYVDDETAIRLTKIAYEKNRTVQDLAECAISESALDYFRLRNDDPAREKQK